MNQTGLRRIPPDQSSGSGHTLSTPRHPRIKDPILSKRVCFYKSGDPQFSGLRMVINNRTFKTFDALLDSLSKKVPLPFGVRNITTPRGIHAIYTLDELEDGKSYICSDRRKVKPINLALARKKLPPWYHARPATSRRRTVQQARSFPGRNAHRQEPVVVRIPKKLLVFHNGDPTLKHLVVLHKRTTANFESVLEYISELMQFHVVKLHTPDGRRVDGLPGLILCSGTVVAAGREPFKSANYTSQRSPAPTQFSNNRKRQRRSKSLNRKKKYRSHHNSKSRNFSLSSERYIVNRIHNSMAGSSYDCPLPTNPTNSVELESIAGTGGAEGQGCLPPAEDDIEKSFRVNQDGSMTVEMKVRLTLKEEETIHWTTTLSRSNVANELNVSCLPEPVAEEEICSPALYPVGLEAPASSIDSINKDKTKDNHGDPGSPRNGAFNRSSKKEDNTKVQTTMVSPTRAPTPGYKEIRKKQASVESVESLTATGIQDGVVSSYSYKEQMENGAMSEEYCVVKQRTTRPVPKPRRLCSVDCSNIKSRNISSFKSSEILQIESSSEEVTETVLHIYEQQMCQDNFLANICAHDIPPYGRPATSETGEYSSNNEFEPEFWRPSTASESISIWKTENSVKSKSLPDFSSHVASTFGSSSKALLAFLSVMTLNEGIYNSDRDRLNANVSCAEALKMIESLREIANIKDSQKLEASLCNLQRSTSKQLLQSWRGFQELSDKCKSCSLTPNDSQELIVNKAKNDYSIEEKVIDRIIDNFDIPKKLKEELMSLSENVDKENMSTRFIEKDELSQKENRDSKISHCSREDVMTVGIVTEDNKTNVDVSSMIKKFAIVNEPKQSDMHNIPLRTETLKHKPPAEVKDKQVTEKTQHRIHNEDKVSQETANMNRVIECRKLHVQSEGSMSIPESGHITDEVSGADEEGRNISSASKDGERRKQSLCSSDAGEDHSRSEEQKQQSSNYYVELNARKESVSSPDSQNQRLSEEEQPEEPQIQNPRQRLKVSVDESIGNSDADEPTTSDEEQLEFERNELKVRSEESLSGIEEEKESIGEEDQFNDLPDPEEVRCNKLQALIREAKEISSEDEDPKKDDSSLLNSDSLAERERFSADEHGSCEEQVEMEQIRSSVEEEISFCEKESSSEKEERLETPVAMDKKVVEKVKLQSEEIISQSIAERINLLEKQVADAQKRKNVAESPALKRAPQRNVHLESDSEDSASESPFTRSAPQSSLSFSYDSGGVITTEPEGNRVRYIREMFLAKSATDNRQRHQRFQSPNASELSELRADTSASGGYQSQTSNEMSGGEDDSARKSITKGFVRRTIERLYGKKDPDEKASERPPSAPKQKKKELSSIFSPFHSARTKATTELSYFNSTNALDSLTEATRCIAFNAQVGPGDSVPIDNGRWLLRENTPIRKSVSEPVAINKTLTNSPPGEEMCEDTEQNAPNSFYSTTSELEDKTKSLSRKCTYFSLPHASDSDACQDDIRPASKSSVSSEAIAKDTSEDAKTWGERNGILPAGGVTDFRMMDNKVHPLTEVPSDGEVVVVQPRRGQGVMDRRLQEPDVLDLLYNFCGEHCPIL
nr:PREDICTED: oxygen-regulated protein 1 [Paralichthys olivaceus]